MQTRILEDQEVAEILQTGTSSQPVGRPVKREDLFHSAHTPTQQELDEAIEIIRKIMPTRSIEKAIGLIYQMVVNKVAAEQLFMGQFSPPFKYTPENASVVRVYRKDENISPSLERDERRLVAKSFITRGYGLTESIGKMGGQQYRSLIATVLTLSFRRLQDFLRIDCHKQLQQLNPQQMRTLLPKLLSCGDFLPEEQADVLYKFMKGTFSLSDVRVEEVESVRLYYELMRLVYGRPIEVSKLFNRVKKEEEEDISGDGHAPLHAAVDIDLDMHIDEPTKKETTKHEQIQLDGLAPIEDHSLISMQQRQQTPNQANIYFESDDDHYYGHSI